jgi:long-subunit acyl-CoA synthetase (AMP-forming)
MVKYNNLISGVLARMTIGNLVLFILAYVAFRVIQQIVYYRFLSPIKDFPGPFWASVTRIWIAWYNLMESEVQALEAVHKKYGEQTSLSSGHERFQDTPLMQD